jgi:DNA-binding NtrC family response regulator
MEVLQFVGESAAMSALRPEIDRTAASNAKVLITGESGVGKEVVARHIHAAGPRRAAPLVAINCAGVPDSLLESELFGYLRGSFTDAYRDKSGLLEAADRGTVFLDEVGEMTPRMQGLLLRFLETGEVQRVGSTGADTRVDVRIIAATNRDLAQAIVDRSFRHDLYYRLNVIHLRVPPLRDRVEDIRPLLEHFTRSCCAQASVLPLVYTPGAMALLLAYHWPGNVRELKNVVERLVVRVRGSQVEPSHLPPEVRQAASAVRPAASRSDTVDSLFTQMTRGRKSFWSIAYVPFMQRDLTRTDLRALVSRGLAETSGDYDMLARLFNVEVEDYRRFLNVLRKHQCFVPIARTRVARSHASS